MSDGAVAGGSVRSYGGENGFRRFREDLASWLDEHSGDFESSSEAEEDLAGEVARSRSNQRRLWDAGWLRFGWPASVGGLGDCHLLRAAVAEEIATRGLMHETLFAVVEVLLPTVIAVAPDIAALYGQTYLAGDEGWCQGFSEPDAGSDLASLRCRAEDAGECWAVTGQKIWTSYAQFASRMVLLVRTGSSASRHKGITALLVDMGSPGVEVRPLRAINGHEEFSETFFDEVLVPKSRVIGEVGAGWDVAMRMLRSERGAIFWMLSTLLLKDLRRLTEEIPLAVTDDEHLGHVLASVAGLRLRSWSTQHRLCLDDISIPETSIDKILMASSEQEFFDFVLSAFGGVLELDDSSSAGRWRSKYMYSRAASIYGGTAEIQRNIVADQLLSLRGLR